MKYRHIVVEGPIGVGKTSLCKRLAERFDARLVLERTDEVPFLDKFYADTRRYAFQTQIAFFLSRYKQQMQLMEREVIQEITVADYMFGKDRIFASYVLDESAYSVYTDFFDLFAHMIPKHDLVILLQADVDVLMKRIGRRGKDYEAKLDRKYLEGLIEAYDGFFFDYNETPLLVVNTNEVDLAAGQMGLDDLVEQIENITSGTTYYVPSDEG